MPLIFTNRNNFQTDLFNEVFHQYMETLYSELVKQYTLTSAKGGSGFEFRDKPKKLYDAIVAGDDMPYHIHILNGIVPAFKLLEYFLKERNELNRVGLKEYLKALLVGFTLHDTDKLVGKNLREAVREDVPRLCEELNVNHFFKTWKDWISDIQYLALRTEKRTEGYALNYATKSKFIHSPIGDTSRIADQFASFITYQEEIEPHENQKQGFKDITDFYEQLCRKKFGRKALTSIWTLSYISVSQNIYTLLSQKLLFAAQTFIQNTRNDIRLVT